MLNKAKNIILIILTELLSAAVITWSVVPGFRNIGHLFLQVLYTVLIVFSFLFISDERKISPVTVSHSLVFMTAYWVIYAITAQIKLHIRTGDNSFEWRHLFYYDRPALLIVVYFAVLLFYAVRFMRRYEDEDFYKKYKKFQKITFISFAVYYALILVYCFFIVRNTGGITDINLIPFNFLKVMKEGEYEYEFIFLFFGNIAIFMPFGVILPVLFKNRHKPLIFAFPFIISIGIEILQLILRNGQTDIDDVILNVIGFFIGYLFKVLLDKLVFKISHGKCSSVFVL